MNFLLHTFQTFLFTLKPALIRFIAQFLGKLAPPVDKWNRLCVVPVYLYAFLHKQNGESLLRSTDRGQTIQGRCN